MTKTLQYLELALPVPFQLLYHLGIKDVTVKQWLYKEPQLWGGRVYWGVTEISFSDFNDDRRLKKQRLQVELFVHDLLEKFVDLSNVKNNIEMYTIFFDLQEQTVTLKEHTYE